MTDLLREFKVHKTTGTHGDALKAAGLADLLQSVFNDPVEIRDEGPYLLVALPEALGDRIQQLSHSPRYPWLKTNPDEEAPQGTHSVDVSAEFTRIKRWAENRKKLSHGRTADPDLLQLIQQDAPIPRWWILAALTPTKLKGIATWNRVARAIADRDMGEFRLEVEAALRVVGIGGVSPVRWPASSSGVFCPSQIKGFNELKPQGTSRGSVAVDPFEEWLRYQGYWHCANLISSSDGDDIRVYVPIPGHISSRSLGRLASGLEREHLMGCGPKSDALATVALARLLIEHSKEYHAADIEPDTELSLPSGATPAQVVSGLYVTHYTKTSQRAYGVQAMFSLAVPDWFPIERHEDAETWLAILDEHQRVIRGLQEDRSDEMGLLIAYRRFLQARGEPGFWALVEFMEEYGSLVMRANGLRQENRIRWMTRLTDEYFRRITVAIDNHLAKIVDDPGFDAVARAVRHSTVTAQNRRARYKAKLSPADTWREIRYELLHDIHRTRKVPGNAFVERIGEFVSRYNYENARHRETEGDPKAAPANVSDEEMRSFLVLIDMHGTSLVGALLAAYGTCKEKWEPDDGPLGAAPEEKLDAQSPRTF